MIRGWLEPGIIVILCCHAAAWLSQSASDAASRLTAGIQPHDHFCVHCGHANPVDIEDLIYRCSSCQGRNCRWLEFDSPQPTESESEPGVDSPTSSAVAER